MPTELNRPTAAEAREQAIKTAIDYTLMKAKPEQLWRAIERAQEAARRDELLNIIAKKNAQSPGHSTCVCHSCEALRDALAGSEARLDALAEEVTDEA